MGPSRPVDAYAAMGGVRKPPRLGKAVPLTPAMAKLHSQLNPPDEPRDDPYWRSFNVGPVRLGITSPFAKETKKAVGQIKGDIVGAPKGILNSAKAFGSDVRDAGTGRDFTFDRTRENVVNSALGIGQMLANPKDNMGHLALLGTGVAGAAKGLVSKPILRAPDAPRHDPMKAYGPAVLAGQARRPQTEHSYLYDPKVERKREMGGMIRNAMTPMGLAHKPGAPDWMDDAAMQVEEAPPYLTPDTVAGLFGRKALDPMVKAARDRAPLFNKAERNFPGLMHRDFLEAGHQPPWQRSDLGNELGLLGPTNEGNKMFGRSKQDLIKMMMNLYRPGQAPGRSNQN